MESEAKGVQCEGREVYLAGIGQISDTTHMMGGCRADNSCQDIGGAEGVLSNDPFTGIY